MKQITRVADLGELRLAIVFDDGTVVLANFAQTAAKGGIFARLLNPDYFRKAQIGQSGRTLRWPNGLDFCADAIYGPRRRSKLPRQTKYGVQVLPEAAVLA